MLEIKHLETILALEEKGNLQDAADYLNVTQSALSHQLRDLETKLGVQVLNRRTRPAKLSGAGLRILSLAQEVMPKLQQAERELGKLALGTSGRLHLAIDCHSCFQWLMPVLDAYRLKLPDVSLDLSAAFSFAPLPALQRGDLDLVITSDPDRDSDLIYIPLFQYELVLVLNHGNPLAAKPYIKPQDLSKQTLITYPVERERMDIFNCFLDPANIEPAAVRQTELTPMIIQLIHSDRGVAALPHWAVYEYLHQGWIKTSHIGDTKGIWRTLFASIRKEDAHSSVIQTFIELAQDLCFKHLSGIKKVE